MAAAATMDEDLFCGGEPHNFDLPEKCFSVRDTTMLTLFVLHNPQDQIYRHIYQTNRS